MKPLKKILSDVVPDGKDYEIDTISKNMGWLTWTDIFKTTLRSAIPEPDPLDRS